MTISEDEKEWARQISRLKGEWDFKSSLITAKREGREEGMTDAARGMKAENIPIETIVKITGLTPEQVAAL